MASDLVPAPWNDLVADGLKLPFRDRSLDAIVALDFVHHVARPGPLFEEAARVLSAGGRVSMVEPWVTPLSYPVYRFLHEEGCRLSLDPWNPFPAARSADKEPFEGDGAVPFRLVRDTKASRWAELGFDAPAGHARERLRLPREPRLQAALARRTPPVGGAAPPRRRARPPRVGRGDAGPPPLGAQGLKRDPRGRAPTARASPASGGPRTRRPGAAPARAGSRGPEAGQAHAPSCAHSTRKDANTKRNGTRW